MAKKIVVSRLEMIAASRSAAMPAVKNLIKNHGRNNVLWCINQLREYENKIKKLKQLKQEARKLEREIK